MVQACKVWQCKVGQSGSRLWLITNMIAGLTTSNVYGHKALAYNSSKVRSGNELLADIAPLAEADCIQTIQVVLQRDGVTCNKATLLQTLQNLQEHRQSGEVCADGLMQLHNKPQRQLC